MIYITRERAERLEAQFLRSIETLTARLATISKQEDVRRYWNTKTALTATQQKLEKLRRMAPR